MGVTYLWSRNGCNQLVEDLRFNEDGSILLEGFHLVRNGNVWTDNERAVLHVPEEKVLLGLKKQIGDKKCPPITTIHRNRTQKKKKDNCKKCTMPNLLPEVYSSMKKHFDAFSYPSYPGGYEGDGIVILGGGVKYYPSAYAMIRLLRIVHGCKLPIQLWYLGRAEMDHKMIELIEKYDVQTVNGAEFLKSIGVSPRIWGGWQAKGYAITYSPFKRVLFLDADNIPRRDPSYLFEQAEPTGAILWPDLVNRPGCDITEDCFKLFNLPVPGYTTLSGHTKPSDYKPVESGQVLINKEKHWHTLALIREINDYSDFFYPEPRADRHWYMYGDKSSFYLAFEVTQSGYKMPGPTKFDGDVATGGFLQKDMDGEIIFQHKCQPREKLLITKKNKYPKKFLFSNEMEEGLAELRKEWDTVWSWKSLKVLEKEAAEKLLGTWRYYTKQFENGRKIVLMSQGRISGIAKNWVLTSAGSINMLKIGKVFLEDRGGYWANEAEGVYLTKGPPPKFESPDLFIWSEIMEGNCYQLPISMKGMRVLDVGGHCGIFAYACLKRNAEKILSVEPCKENFDILTTNIKSKQIYALNKALWSEHTKLKFFQPSGAEHSGGWSSYNCEEGAFEQDTITLEDCQKILEHADLCKLDCEGAEWELMEKSDFSWINSVVGELHYKLPHHCPAEFEKLLRKQGFNLITIKVAEPTGMFYAHRTRTEVPQEVAQWLASAQQ